MTILLLALSTFVLYLIAYHTYGKWLAKRIFKLDPEAVVPSVALNDDLDYVPTKKSIVFGHHFTSIAASVNCDIGHNKVAATRINKVAAARINGNIALNKVAVLRIAGIHLTLVAIASADHGKGEGHAQGRKEVGHPQS
jgi:hypothetical protein